MANDRLPRSRAFSTRPDNLDIREEAKTFIFQSGRGFRYPQEGVKKGRKTLKCSPKGKWVRATKADLGLK
ncbi:MAG: hypothetical protein DMG57_39090 [Acidobacteria bacterium]|nr:MAG: hypothetical protein DMG57_39090 [Acidobacteriota bacterium]